MVLKASPALNEELQGVQGWLRYVKLILAKYSVKLKV